MNEAMQSSRNTETAVKYVELCQTPPNYDSMCHEAAAIKWVS